MPQEFVPKQIVVLRALPKNSTGKVRKEAIKDLNVPV
jgi:acyl-coenzyme A synthetase/AMP-(fatty) acid ligase